MLTSMMPRREQKLVPNIIYFVESLEKHLIKISKKPKSIDLMRGFSRSTARDFKVDFDKITMPEERTKKGKVCSFLPTKKSDHACRTESDLVCLFSCCVCRRSRMGKAKMIRMVARSRARRNANRARTSPSRKEDRQRERRRPEA